MTGIEYLFIGWVVCFAIVAKYRLAEDLVEGLFPPLVLEGFMTLFIAPIILAAHLIAEIVVWGLKKKGKTDDTERFEGR